MAYNIFILDPSKYDVWFAGQKYKQPRLEYVRDWCIEEKADLCFNLGLFNFTDKLACSYVRGKGNDLAYGCDEPNKSKNWSDLLVINGQNSCRGYCNGIVNGVVKLNTPFGGSRTRNGIGMTYDGHIIIAQCGTKSTEKAFCEAVNSFVKKQNKSVKLFILQDGGGSTSEYSSLSKLNFAPEGQRKVATVVCVKFKTKPTFSTPIYNGCKGNDVALLQLALGGVESDGIAGSGTANRIKQMQSAYAFPKALQCGIASGYTLSKMGFKTNF